MFFFVQSELISTLRRMLPLASMLVQDSRLAADCSNDSWALILGRKARSNSRLVHSSSHALEVQLVLRWHESLLADPGADERPNFTKAACIIRPSGTRRNLGVSLCIADAGLWSMRCLGPS